MSTSVLYLSISLDGCVSIADDYGGGDGGGDDGARLHRWRDRDIYVQGGITDLRPLQAGVLDQIRCAHR